MKPFLLTMLFDLARNRYVRIFIPPIAGFFFYGAWALWVNSGHGWLSASQAALTQGAYSFTITLVLALMIERLFVYLEGVVWRSVWVFIIVVLLLAVSSSLLNFVAGTPNIVWTILPGLLVSSVYSAIYIITLNRLP